MTPTIPRRDVEPFGGSLDTAATTYWAAGGCVEFALALKQTFPQLRIAVELFWYHGEEALDHAYACDAEFRYDIYGSHPHRPGRIASPDAHRVVLDLTADELVARYGASESNARRASAVVLDMFVDHQEQDMTDSSFTVEIDGQYGENDGAIRLMHYEQEIVMWDSQEWIEDPSLVFVIANAIRTGFGEGAQAVADPIGVVLTGRSSDGIDDEWDGTLYLGSSHEGPIEP